MTKYYSTLKCLWQELDLILTNLTGNALWIVDSGAFGHMTSISCHFKSYISLFRIKNRLIPIFKNLNLSFVLHIPKLSCNLFSVNKFTTDQNCVAKFFPDYI